MSDFFYLILHIDAFLGDNVPYDLAVDVQNNNVIFGKNEGNQITKPQIICPFPKGCDLCEELYQALMEYFGSLPKPLAIFNSDGWSYYLIVKNVSIRFPQGNIQWIKNRINADEEELNIGSR